MRYSAENDDIIRILIWAGNGLSLAGSLFIWIVYARFPGLRTFAFKLILYLSLSDIINSIAYFLPSDGPTCVI